MPATDYPASPVIVAAKLYLLVHFIFRKFILICFLWISWHSPDFWWNINLLNPQKLPLLNLTPHQNAPLGVSWGQFVQPLSIPRFICTIIFFMCKIDSQSVQPFDHNCPVFWIVDPIKPPTMHATLGYRGANYLSLCPFPDESTDVYQIWCQSVQPFDSFPRLMNVWPPNPPPDMSPGGIEGWLVFSICPFPDESADVNQSWYQSVQPFDSFPDFWIGHPLKPPKCPLVSLRSNCLAYIHSQMNLHMCTKFDANRTSRLTSSQDFWICDPLKPPEMSPCFLRLNLFGIYPFPDESAHVCQIWCQSVQPFGSFSWICTKLVLLLATGRAVSRKNMPKTIIYTSKIIILARTCRHQSH